MAEPPLVLTAEQAAEVAGCHIQTIYQWRKEDPTFPARKFGRVRIPRDAFLRWLQGQAA